MTKPKVKAQGSAGEVLMRYTCDRCKTTQDLPWDAHPAVCPKCRGNKFLKVQEITKKRGAENAD